MSRADLKAALRGLVTSPSFHLYVNTLQSELADVMGKLILTENREIRDELCAEARVYRDLLSGINNNIEARK